MYVREICAEGIFVTFPWWLKNVKSRSKITLFTNERHFEIWFPKRRTITFFWNKLSKLHKKDPILHVATTFSLKQGETRTSHGPIPHPLMWAKQHYNMSLLMRVLDKHLTPPSAGNSNMPTFIQWIYLSWANPSAMFSTISALMCKSTLPCNILV